MARKGYRRGAYKFTYKRKAALARAQAISARKRKGDSPIKKIGKIAGIAGAVGATAYLGYRYRGTIGKTASGWKNAVSPGAKEKTIVASGISADAISSTVTGHTTQIGWYQRAQADKAREALAPRPPRNVDTDKRTKHQVDKLMREAKRNPDSITSDNRVQRRRAAAKATGKKSASLTGTPGGTKTPKKAQKPSGENHGGFTEDQWQAILGFDEKPEAPIPLRAPKK